MKLLLTLISLALLACAGPPGVRLVDDATNRSLGQVEVRLFIDDGVRCVTTPCPTDSREWQGRTDATGRVEFPAINPGETATLYVADYPPVAVDLGRGTIRLQGPPEPVPPRQKLSLRTGFEDDARILTVRVENPGPDPIGIVNPDPARLAHYGDWGGWSLLIKDARGPFVPLPFPGPYVAAGLSDRRVLEAGESLTVQVPIGNWRRPGTSHPANHDVSFAEATGRLIARARWGGMPDHLEDRQDSPPVIASAKTRRAPAR